MRWPTWKKPRGRRRNVQSTRLRPPARWRTDRAWPDALPYLLACTHDCRRSRPGRPRTPLPWPATITAPGRVARIARPFAARAAANLTGSEYQTRKALVFDRGDTAERVDGAPWPNRRYGTRVNRSSRQRHIRLQADEDFLMSFLHLR